MSANDAETRIACTGHIGWERFNMMASVNILHVPYKGASLAVIDVLGGQILMTFSIIAATART